MSGRPLKTKSYLGSSSDKPSMKKSKHKMDPQLPSYIQCSELDMLPQTTIDEYMLSNSAKISDPQAGLKFRPIISFDYLPSDTKGEAYRYLSTFSTPTAIQSMAWPFLFAGRDIIGVAETGSGKTLAFGIPCVRKVMEINEHRSSRRISAVIITPTRELAIQVSDQLNKLLVPGHITSACIFGGVSKDSQRSALKMASIVVATPGRLKDLLNDESITLKKVKYFVLDEADRMLDKGFEQDIKEITHFMPSPTKRQTVLFTATWPTNVRQLAASLTNNPVMISIGDPSSEIRANTRIKQIVQVMQQHEKEQKLIVTLNEYQREGSTDDKILVFCLYKKEAMRIERFIKSKGFNVAGIHGDLSQYERLKSLESFKSGTVPILVATDVAARGLDIPSVKLVLNVTFPLTIEDYVHRIGR